MEFLSMVYVILEKTLKPQRLEARGLEAGELEREEGRKGGLGDPKVYYQMRGCSDLYLFLILDTDAAK